MGLLTKETLLPTLDQRLATASSVDVAVAWATNGPALDRLIDFARRRRREDVRVIVGTWNETTDPDSLERLDKHCDLHVIPGEYAHFHPKYYRFNNCTTSFVWIGSANLTTSGFTENTELVFETEGSQADKDWFDSLFGAPTADNALLIAEYRARWRRGAINGRLQQSDHALAHCDHPLELLLGRALTWAGFVAALRRCDFVMRAVTEQPGQHPSSIYSLRTSYLATLMAGHQALRRQDWSSFTPRDQHALLGLAYQGHDYSHMGGLRHAVEAKAYFAVDAQPHAEIRRHIKATLDAFDAGAPANLPDSGQRCVEQLRRIPGIGVAAATRLMALFAPGRAISVNPSNCSGLEALSGVPAARLQNGQDYDRLLAWLQRQVWYGSEPPKDPFEQRLWHDRAALVDAFAAGYGLETSRRGDRVDGERRRHAGKKNPSPSPGRGGF